MLVLSVAFVAIVVVPLVTDLSPGAAAVLEAMGWLIWAAFAVEYLTLLYLAPDRGRMIRTHIPDLVIIALPFLRPLRAFRVLRLLRAAGGVARATVAVRRILSRPGFGVFLAFLLVVLVAAALLVYAFERGQAGSNINNVADALWWALGHVHDGGLRRPLPGHTRGQSGGRGGHAARHQFAVRLNTYRNPPGHLERKEGVFRSRGDVCGQALRWRLSPPWAAGSVRAAAP